MTASKTPFIKCIVPSILGRDFDSPRVLSYPMKTTFIDKISRIRLAENLLVGRTMYGWSQERLGLECDLKRTYVGALERQEINPGIDNLDKLAHAFGISTHVLLLRPADAYVVLRSALENSIMRG